MNFCFHQYEYADCQYNETLFWLFGSHLRWSIHSYLHLSTIHEYYAHIIPYFLALRIFHQYLCFIPLYPYRYIVDFNSISKNISYERPYYITKKYINLQMSLRVHMNFIQLFWTAFNLNLKLLIWIIIWHISGQIVLNII